MRRNYCINQHTAISPFGWVLNFIPSDEVNALPSSNPLDWSSFEYLARAAGLNPEDPHMQELFPYVQSALASNQTLREIDTTGFEPDTAFDPAQFYQD